jgi:gluconokinase
MAAGQALTDNDRAEWLHALSAILAESRDQHQGVVVACSALKKAYRNILRQGAADALFVHLQGSESVLMQRMQQRPTHYMPPSLLQSQLAILESPEADEASLTLDVMTLPQQQCQQVIAHLQTLNPHAVAHH